MAVGAGGARHAFLPFPVDSKHTLPGGLEICSPQACSGGTEGTPLPASPTEVTDGVKEVRGLAKAGAIVGFWRLSIR